MRIAVIDDANDVALALVALLIDYGFDAVALDPPGYETVDWETFDVAVVDLLLGDVDGRDVLAWLAAYAPQVRRVAMSGIESWLVALGPLAHATLGKPFWAADLERILRPDG